MRMVSLSNNLYINDKGLKGNVGSLCDMGCWKSTLYHHSSSPATHLTWSNTCIRIYWLKTTRAPQKRWPQANRGVAHKVQEFIWNPSFFSFSCSKWYLYTLWSFIFLRLIYLNYTTIVFFFFWWVTMNLDVLLLLLFIFLHIVNHQYHSYSHITEFYSSS